MNAARQPLEPPLVYRAYVHEVNQRGRRGAYRRTAERFGCSGERVRQIVHAEEQRKLRVETQRYVTLERRLCQVKQLTNERIEREIRNFRALAPHDFRADARNAADGALLYAYGTVLLMLAGWFKHPALGVGLTLPAVLACCYAASCGRWYKEAKGWTTHHVSN